MPEHEHTLCFYISEVTFIYLIVLNQKVLYIAIYALRAIWRQMKYCIIKVHTHTESRQEETDDDLRV